jgi:hypothetical protein
MKNNKPEIAYRLADSYLKMEDASLRDYFAAKVLPAVLAVASKGDWPAKEVAQVAYTIADAMMDERKKQ